MRWCLFQLIKIVSKISFVCAADYLIGQGAIRVYEVKLWDTCTTKLSEDLNRRLVRVNLIISELYLTLILLLKPVDHRRHL